MIHVFASLRPLIIVISVRRDVGGVEQPYYWAQEVGMLRVILFTADNRAKWVCFRFFFFFYYLFFSPSFLVCAVLVKAKAKRWVLGEHGIFKSPSVQFVRMAENFHDEPKLRVRSQNGDAVQTMSVITLLFCLCCGTRSVLLVSRQFHNDEKDCSLEWPNRATAAPGSVPALPSMINLVYDACGRVAVVPLTKTPCQLLRYSTKTLKQPVHQIPSAPSFCCLSDVAFLRCGLGWHGGFLSRRASHVLTEFHWLLCGNNLVDFF